MSESALTSIALLGTARGGELPPCPHDALDGPWQSLDSSQILIAAALEASALATGLTLEKGTPLPPAEPDDRTPIPVTAADQLSLILSGNTPECLPEFLHYSLADNFRAPHSLAPFLLDHGQKNRALRPQLCHLLGPRGSWLAQRHSTWDWVSNPTSSPEDAWEIGTTAERLHWLRETRQNDLQKALAAIQSTWKSDDPAFRLSLIELAQKSLSPTDESFLEPALNDGRREIRQAATTALLQLPSAFRARSLERAKPYLSLKGKKLTLTPPSKFDPTWKADGLREKPPVKTGERAWWLRQILARIPLPDWSQLLSIPSEKILSLKVDPDWQEAVHLAWIDSAKFHPAPDFVPALIKLSPQSTTELLAPLTVAQTYDILDTLPAELVLPQLNRLATPPEENHPCLKLILKHLLKGKATSRPEAHRLALCLPPDQIPPTLATISKQKSLDSMTEEFARTLEFRQGYLQPLTSS